MRIRNAISSVNLNTRRGQRPSPAAARCQCPALRHVITLEESNRCARGRALSKTRFRVLQRGVTLIECLVYMGAFAVVLSIGSAALYRCWDDNLAISRDADDIVRTLKAGEAWRADIRSASGAIHVKNDSSGQAVIIPSGKNQITYSFDNGEVRKQTGQSGPWVVLLPKVKESQMERDPRDHVTGWRWELELESRRKNAKVRPLFTFEAVPGNALVQ